MLWSREPDFDAGYRTPAVQPVTIAPEHVQLARGSGRNFSENMEFPQKISAFHLIVL
jgi:hypothetical protein